MNKPLKRHASIQPLSREHHHGLLLCWKIRTGFAKGISPDRIKKYIDWFFEHHLRPHFKSEEEHLFPILGDEHELIKKALAHHRRLSRLFTSDKNLEKTLNQIEEELESHVRFEERILFNEIQQAASEDHFAQINQSLHDKPFVENTNDEFWK